MASILVATTDLSKSIMLYPCVHSSS